MAAPCCPPLVSFVPTIAFDGASGQAAILSQVHLDSRLPQPFPMLYMPPVVPMLAPIQTETLNGGNSFGCDSTDEAVAWTFPESNECRAYDENFVDPILVSPNQFVGFWQQPPLQFQMDMSTLFPSAVTDDAVMDSTLRRRSCGNYDSRSAEIDTVEDMDDEAHEAAWVERNDWMWKSADGLLAQLSEADPQGLSGQKTSMELFRSMSFSGKVSSHAAQDALTKASSNQAAVLVQGLHGHVRNAVQSKYANYVLQKMVEIMPAGRTIFIVEELIGFGVEASRHAFACRVVCRILEHMFLAENAIAQLLDEILTEAEELCSHEFGGFVIRHILEFGFDSHRQRVANALRTNLTEHAKNPQGSHVVESALRYCSKEDQLAIAKQLLARKDQLLSIASNRCGRHVTKALLSTTDVKELAVVALQDLAPHLQNSRYGKSAFQMLKSLNSSVNRSPKQRYEPVM